MKDIDFDELDKAVNSLMSSADAPVRNKEIAETSDMTADKRPSLAVNRPSQVKNEAIEGLTLSALARPQSTPAKPAPAVRRSGRFMDVVDSSSELNPLRKPVSAPSRDALRRSQSAPTIEPIVNTATTNQSVSSAALQSSTPATPPKPAEAASSVGESVQVRRVAKDEVMPDPLELLGDMPEMKNDAKTTNDSNTDTRPAAAFGATNVDASKVPVRQLTEDAPAVPTSSGSVDLSQALQDQLDAVNPEATDDSPAVEVIKNESVDEEAESSQFDELEKSAQEMPANNESATDDSTLLPSESPFVTDAKVEKRPLGANAATMNTVEPLVSLDELMKQDQPFEQAEIEASDTDEPPATPQIPELSSELVAIEATGKITEDTADETGTDQGATPKESSISAPADTSENVGPASIAQQYQSKESTGDASHAPIYDASQYADPVAHPAKKKSGWLWVLSVLILLALGSGGAVALYLLEIIP